MTTPTIVFPDAAATAIGYLADRFADHGETATVHQKVPQERPARFVTVVRGGGVRDSIVLDRPTLMVEAWGTSDADAHDLAQLARAFLHAMRGVNVDGVVVYRVDEFAGPATLPDPDSGQARCVFTLSLLMRGQALDDTGS